MMVSFHYCNSEEYQLFYYEVKMQPKTSFPVLKTCVMKKKKLNNCLVQYSSIFTVFLCVKVVTVAFNTLTEHCAESAKKSMIVRQSQERG